MLEKLINSGIADVTINSDVGKELSKGGLRIQARCEEEGASSSMLLDKIRIRCAQMQEECNCIVDITCHWRPCAEVTGRQ